KVAMQGGVLWEGAVSQGGEEKGVCLVIKVVTWGGDGGGRSYHQAEVHSMKLESIDEALVLVCHYTGNPFKDFEMVNIASVVRFELIFSVFFMDYSGPKVETHLQLRPSRHVICIFETIKSLKGAALRLVCPSDYQRVVTNFNFLITSKVLSGRTSNALSILVKGDNEFHNRNLRAILANDVVSCSTLSDQGYAKDFYDQ
ncbi:hypothetical protein Tco_0054285, partial [Tanacetum coccineum]